MSIFTQLRKHHAALGEGRTFELESPVTDVVIGLENAIAKSRSEYFGEQQYATVFQKTAAIGIGICARHVFGNGNKRIALITMSMTLTLNGWALRLPPAIAKFLMLRIAHGKNGYAIEQVADVLGAHSYQIGRRLSDDPLWADAVSMEKKGIFSLHGAPDTYPTPSDKERQAFVGAAVKSTIDQIKKTSKSDSEIYLQDGLDLGGLLDELEEMLLKSA